jgi:hypothetical protein
MQLAGVVAVEVAGGPEIPFHSGREASPLSFLSQLSFLDFNKKKILPNFFANLA